jgi:hypothetical protein
MPRKSSFLAKERKAKRIYCTQDIQTSCAIGLVKLLFDTQKTTDGRNVLKKRKGDIAGFKIIVNGNVEVVLVKRMEERSSNK